MDSLDPPIYKNEPYKNKTSKNEEHKNKPFKNESYKSDPYKNEHYKNEVYKNGLYKDESYKNGNVDNNEVAKKQEKENKDLNKIKEDPIEESKSAPPDDGSSSKISQISQQTSSTGLNAGYDSWFCAEEQQHIVDMLKEVHLRHERQLERNMLLITSRGEISDDSISAEPHNASMTSEEEEDGIFVLVPPNIDPLKSGILDVENITMSQNGAIENNLIEDLAEEQTIKTPTKLEVKDDSNKKSIYLEEPTVSCNRLDLTENQNNKIQNGAEKNLKILQSPLSASSSKMCQNIEVFLQDKDIIEVNRKPAYETPEHKNPQLSEKREGIKICLSNCVGVKTNYTFSQLPQTQVTEFQETTSEFNDMKINHKTMGKNPNGKGCQKNSYFENVEHNILNNPHSSNCSKQNLKLTKTLDNSIDRDIQLEDNTNNESCPFYKLKSKKESIKSVHCTLLPNSKNQKRSGNFPQLKPLPEKSANFPNHDMSFSLLQKHKSLQSTRSVESDTCLYQVSKELKSHPNPIPSLSESCLPPTNRHTYYRRISVEELFRPFKEQKSNKSNDYTSNEVGQTISSPTDHLKQILGIPSPDKIDKTSLKQNGTIPINERENKNKCEKVYSETFQDKISENDTNTVLFRNYEGEFNAKPPIQSLVLKQSVKNFSNSYCGPKNKDIKQMNNKVSSHEDKVNIKCPDKEDNNEQRSLTSSKKYYSDSYKTKKFLEDRQSEYFGSNLEVLPHYETDKIFMQRKGKRKNRSKRFEKCLPTKYIDESRHYENLLFDSSVCFHEKTSTPMYNQPQMSVYNSRRVKYNEKYHQMVLSPNENVSRKQKYVENYNTHMRNISTNKNGNRNIVSHENISGNFCNNVVLNINVLKNVKSSKVKSSPLLDSELNNNASHIADSGKCLSRKTSMYTKNQTDYKPNFNRRFNHLNFRSEHKSNFENGCVTKPYYDDSTRDNAKKNFANKHSMRTQRKELKPSFNNNFAEIEKDAGNAVLKEVHQKVKQNKINETFKTNETQFSSGRDKYLERSLPIENRVVKKTASSYSKNNYKSVNTNHYNYEKAPTNRQLNNSSIQKITEKSLDKVKLPQAVCKDILKNGHFYKNDFIYDYMIENDEKPVDKKLVKQTTNCSSKKVSENNCRQSLLIVENGKFGSFDIKGF